MASWGGEGPQGKSCRECLHWMHAGYLASGQIKKAPCEKTHKLMGGGPTPAIPDFAPACKYFVEIDLPPERFKER